MQQNTEIPFYKNIKLWIIPALTLGLAPFFPEPHIVGKIKWIAGGGAFSGEHPMGAMDWFDVVMHGAPWLMLLIAILFNAVDLIKKQPSS